MSLSYYFMFELYLYKPKRSITLDLYWNVYHFFITRQFYGERLTGFVLEIYEVSDPDLPKLLCSTVLKSGKKKLQCIVLRMTGKMYKWMVRLQEPLLTARDYELCIDINSYTKNKDDFIILPDTIKSLIGHYCNPTITSGYIFFDC